LKVVKTQLEAINNELVSIYNSNSWKIVQKLKDIKVIKWLATKLVCLYKKVKKNKHEKNSIQTVTESAKEDIKDYISAEFIELLEQKEVSDVIAITHKHWMGVQNSTKELFEVCVVLEELNSYGQVVTIGDAIINKQPKKIVFSGFAAGWNTLCSYIKEKAPEIKIIIFWHGSTTHMYEDYSWIRYQEILQLSKDKHIDKLAFAKESMCPIYEKLGMNVGFIKNHVEKIDYPVKKAVNKSSNLRIGIYSSGGTWNKNAYTQIAAASLFENATISLVPYNDRMHVFATQLGLKVEGKQGNISREELLQEFRQNDINLYVTFSECAPLIPIESLNCGTICLTGNNHHYFKGTRLEDLLVVKRPDDATEIYNQALRAFEHKEEIMDLYKEWYEVNKTEAKQIVNDL